MEYKLTILDAADLDIADAIKYYEDVRKGLSMDFELCLEEGYADIIRLPLSYEKRYRNVHIKFIRRFPYGIHYMVEGNNVIILAVFHTSKNPSSWFKRFK